MQLLLQQPEGDRVVELPSSTLFTVGGAVDDGLSLAYFPPRIATLEERAGEVFVTCHTVLSIDGVWTPPEVRRLLLPGERLALSEGVNLSRPRAEVAPAPSGTAAVLRNLLIDPHALGSAASTLTCLTGLDAGKVFPLTEGELVIGRGNEVAIRVRDRAVSRRHARITWHDGAFELEDLGSPNGVYVGGARVDGCTPLGPKAVIELGQTLLRLTAPELKAGPGPKLVSASDIPPSEAAPAEQLVEAPRLKRSVLPVIGFWLLVALGIALLVSGVGVTIGAATGAPA